MDLQEVLPTICRMTYQSALEDHGSQVELFVPHVAEPSFSREEHLGIGAAQGTARDT